jgi:leucyl/phenylalanyl-tRNA---protein transferase
MLGRIPTSFCFDENRAFDEVIDKLSSELYKKNSWVRREVIEVYRALRVHGYMLSIEARTERGLAGAVLGIDLGRCFIIETMLSVSGEGSKAALCHAVKKFARAGYPFIDVQRPHPPDHPCARLFEDTIPIESYRALLAQTLA